MDQLLPELPGLLPGAGVLAIVAWLLVRVMRQATVDKKVYEAAAAAMRQAHAAQLAALEERHATQIADLRAYYDAQLGALRAEVDKLRKDLAAYLDEAERERRARWAAEDEVAELRRKLAGQDGVAR